MATVFATGLLTGPVGSILSKALACLPFGRLGKRYELFDNFKQLPQLNASVGIAANVDFEVLGVNSDIANTDVTFAEKGGINVATPTTTPAANDFATITPHLDAGQTAWAKAGLWGSENSPHLEVALRPASLTACAILVGFREDTTIPADMEVVGSDDNACFFFFSDDSTIITAANSANGIGTGGTKWGMVENINTVDTLSSSNVVASTTEDVVLAIRIDADRCPSYYINGQFIRRGAALKNAVDFIPYIAIMTDTAGVKNMDVRHIRASRLI